MEQDHAKAFLQDAGIKLKIVFIQNAAYKIDKIYINRVGEKIRVIHPGEVIKNCIEISFDTNQWNKAFLESLVKANLPLLEPAGTCQQFITTGQVSVVIAKSIINFSVNQIFKS